MSEFKKVVPETVNEMWRYLQSLHERQRHLKRIYVNSTNNRLEIILDFAAHVSGYPDMYLPLRHGTAPLARRVLENMSPLSNRRFPPSQRYAQELFALIDQHSG